MTATEPDAPDLRTLLIDDDAEQRRLVRTLLERHGIGPIEEARDAASGLDMAAASQPDLILLDIGMPGRSGLDVLPELVDTAPGARIVVLSAFPRARLGSMALARGAVGYVEKRVPPERLVDEILVAAAISELAQIEIDQHEVGGQRISADLPADPVSPRQARALVRNLLGRADRDLVASVELLVSELVTNAITHARSAPSIEVAISPRVVRVEVRDDSPDMPSVRAPDEGRPGGRGLHLVREMSARWGASPSDGGKVVWFEVDRAS